MINSKAYQYVDLMNQAANAANLRNKVIANNVANINTPGYKRKDVEFESYLEQALSGAGSVGQKVENASRDLDKLQASVYTDHQELSYRLDGNNVDVDTENAYLAENQIRYNTLVDQMTNEFSRLRTVLSPN